MLLFSKEQFLEHEDYSSYYRKKSHFHILLEPFNSATKYCPH